MTLYTVNWSYTLSDIWLNQGYSDFVNIREKVIIDSNAIKTDVSRECGFVFLTPTLDTHE